MWHKQESSQHPHAESRELGHCRWKRVLTSLGLPLPKLVDRKLN